MLPLRLKKSIEVSCESLSNLTGWLVLVPESGGHYLTGHWCVVSFHYRLLQSIITSNLKTTHWWKQSLLTHLTIDDDNVDHVNSIQMTRTECWLSLLVLHRQQPPFRSRISELRCIWHPRMAVTHFHQTQPFHRIHSCGLGGLTKNQQIYPPATRAMSRQSEPSSRGGRQSRLPTGSHYPSWQDSGCRGPTIHTSDCLESPGIRTSWTLSS